MGLTVFRGWDGSGGWIYGYSGVSRRLTAGISRRLRSRSYSAIFFFKRLLTRRTVPFADSPSCARVADAVVLLLFIWCFFGSGEVGRRGLFKNGEDDEHVRGWVYICRHGCSRASALYVAMSPCSGARYLLSRGGQLLVVFGVFVLQIARTIWRYIECT